MGPRIAFTTLGCKVNQSETDLLTRQFAAAGYTPVPFDRPADVYVVNTCTVTAVADRKSRQAINGVRKRSPEALVVATGCYASIVGDALGNEETIVIRNRDKDRVVELVDGRLHRHLPEPPAHADVEKYLDVPVGRGRSRSMVKVQDGCDSHCTYCIIPRARGRSRSVPPDAVLRRINGLLHEGHAEVVITGVDLGSYRDGGERGLDLGGLLRLILAETEIPRVRVSSLEPGDFDPDWLALWENPRLCRHLHLPLQAGSAGVLARMERAYTPSEFADMVALCRQRIPGVAITTDVMVGFPGETDDEFAEGMSFIRSISFDGMHVFKYSVRPGTRAARMPDQVSEACKAERSRMLREEAADGSARLLQRHQRAVASVVWENEQEGIYRGLTDTNVRIYASGSFLAGGVSRMRLGGPFRDGLWAEPLLTELQLTPV